MEKEPTSGYVYSLSFGLLPGHNSSQSRFLGSRHPSFSTSVRNQGALQALRAQKVNSGPLHWASETQNTLDLQMVNITCRVLSRPSPQALPSIYRELGQDFDERVLPSIVNEVLKSVVAQFNASQLITQREMVTRYLYPKNFP